MHSITDALHESWDDSTVLRRDALLAQCDLKVKSCTLRFVEHDVTSAGDEITKVVQLISCN